MKTYLIKIKCLGKMPCNIFRTIEAESPQEALAIINARFIEEGTADRRKPFRIYEEVKM